jgi:hypothetical protein
VLLFNLGDLGYIPNMRRLLAIALLVILSSSLSAPLLALANDEGAEVPACCKVGGKHHCMMGSYPDHGGRQFATVGERCPSFPKVMAASIHPAYTAPPASAIYAQLQAHPACTAQVEAHHRISFDRSRQKRGPPTVSL